MEYHSVLVMLLIICEISEAAFCEEDGREVCCSGYTRNRTGHCVKCPPGYTGPKCIYSCIYPHYGEDCIMECRCSPEMCDFATGCKFTITTVNPSAPYKTTRQRKLKTSATLQIKDAVTQDHLLEEPTESGSSSSIGQNSIYSVFYITVVLITVFVVSILIYGISYLRKVFASRQNNKLDVHYNANNNSVYDCVEFPRHM